MSRLALETKTKGGGGRTMIMTELYQKGDKVLKKSILDLHKLGNKNLLTSRVSTMLRSPAQMRVEPHISEPNRWPWPRKEVKTAACRLLNQNHFLQAKDRDHRNATFFIIIKYIVVGFETICVTTNSNSKSSNDAASFCDIRLLARISVHHRSRS